MITSARKLFLLIALLAVSFAAAAAVDEAATYKGRTVTSVIDEFRRDGFGFAYSTSLVSDSLLVTVEPTGTDELQIVKQILEPHKLTIRSEEGLWLIVAGEGREEKGEVLLIVRDKRDYEPLEQPTVNGTPTLASPSILAPGIQQYSELEPGVYRIEVVASGFDPALRRVYVEPAKTTAITVLLEAERPEIEAITVSASRYEISRDVTTSKFFIDQRTIQNMPDIGEDPVRVVQRLPGTAASGLSARAHFRGGEEAETGIILNGQRLFDPFHIRDYNNIFSSIDARAIDGVEVFTGGFPARYGDRLSGFVLMDSLDSIQPRHTELGVSVFNTSVLSAGTFSGGDSQWLFSARRSNLGLVLDEKKHGQPSYYDVFSQLAFDLTPDTRLSLNGLYADDAVIIILESDPAELEQAKSETQNSQFWVTLENQWSPVLRSTTVVSLNSFSNHRLGETNDVEKIVSVVDDRRDVDQYGFRQDWFWNQSDTHLVQWGFQAEHSEARYDYMSEAEFFGLAALYQDVDDTISRDLSAAPFGNSFAVYVSDRWKVAGNTIVELGLRWDDQTYTGLQSDSQISPRLSMMHAFSPDTEFRFSWGRYHQSQGIHELQIEDGITDYYPAQRADHIIAGVRHNIRDKYSLRLELFQKDMSPLRPRFENLFDPLALIPELQPDRARIAPSKGRARGVELSIDRTDGPLTWWASYTLSEVYDTVDGVEEPRSWDQRHSLIAGLNWNNDVWDFSLAGNIHSGWPTTSLSLVDAPDPADDPIAIPGPRNADRLGTFASVDARISRRFRVGRGTITAFFEVANIFDRKNLCCRDYDLVDDTDDELELSDDYWLPRLPAIGFLWEFQ